ncbi:sulfotransferase family protein [Dyella tabacisoli]|uniref:Sulfotransferase n=1 Tax=Dyella tabacisoli TaxID=2282381 RepID=A0A369UL10_9GAMM|nr:sulfotransferase [Dyella tabacisoli]RDD80408.1 sulfotransferase [Dyella tabacisoli]
MSGADQAIPRFVIGTGRCGSTLLSKMLAKCPGLLMLDEFFAGIDRDSSFTGTQLSGKQFAHQLLHDRTTIELIRTRYPLLMQAGAPTLVNRTVPPFLSGNQSIPALCVALAGAAQKMGLNPFLLTGRATRFLETLSEQPFAAHCRTLFDWLAQQSGSVRGWCERSGASLEFLGDLVESFPQGRFLHLHRDGLHTALSMHAHPIFALQISLRLKPMLAEEAQLAASPPVDISVDPIVRRLTAEAPTVEDCGRYWSSAVMSGAHAAAGLGKDRYMDIRYEDLVADPLRYLESIADFFALDSRQAWLREAAALADSGASAKRLPSLSPHALAALQAACLPGQQLLGRA